MEKQTLKHITSFLLLFLSISQACIAMNGIEPIATVSSPDQSIRVDLFVSEAGSASYEVYKSGDLIVANSALGLSFAFPDYSRNLQFTESVVNPITETYTLPSGKKHLYTNHCNELTATFTRLGNTFNVVLRVYDEGFAFRYVIGGEGELTLRSEVSEVRVNNFAHSWAQGYRTDYSGYYDKRDWTQNSTQKEFCAPLLASAGNNYLLLTEAANYGDYATSKLIANTETGSYTFAPVGTVQVNLPLATPWRAVLLGIAGNMADIVESVMIENLNPPTTLQDLSWVIPGRSSWDWGGEDMNNNTGFEQVQKRYIDLAHHMGWEYFLLDDGWEGNVDYTLQDVIRYADSQSVGVFVWAHQNRFTTNRQQIHSLLSEWKSQGVKGIKVDFWEDDSQAMMKKYDTLLEVAGELQLLVNLHGCSKPSGTRRKYPHLLTHEAVLGGEMYLHNSHMTPADHNINLTLARNVIGPMDYTPGDFGTNTGIIRQHTTWAHQLALLTAFESGIQCYVDCPQNYQYHIAESFMKHIPAAWDDIICLEAKPDSYSTIARRKGDDWYIATLCNESRALELPLTFLDAGQTYHAYTYRDGDCNSEISFEYNANVNTQTTLHIPLLKSGGATIHLSPREDLAKPEVRKYEAESARSYGTKVTEPDALCSGGKYMTDITKGITLKFQNITVEQEGEYAVTLYYMTNEERVAYVKINDGEERYYTFNKTGGWTGKNMGFTTLTLPLKAGVNILEIGNKNGYAPNFDRITVKALTDPTATPITQIAKERTVPYKITQTIDSFHLHLQTPATFTLFSVDGRMVTRRQLTAGHHHIFQLPKGLHIVNINTARESFSEKIDIK